MQQLDDVTELLAFAVTVHQDLKLRVAPPGLSGFDVQKVDVVFLLAEIKIQELYCHMNKHSFLQKKINLMDVAVNTK